ncbi:MAG TPA: hypothetical protein VHZ54_05675 [Solirubrobacterales bacterium]|nr:hypothetical protein [Solirubrobacterales bacterium]
MKLSALGIFLLALLAPAVARAEAKEAPKTVTRPASFQFEAELPETDGFIIFLRAEDHRDVKLQIESEGEGPYTTLSYSTVGQVRRHGIDVDFGRFGRIDLHFAGKPKRERFPYPNCKGKKAEVEESGDMEGAIEFEALGGIAKLHADQVSYAHTWQSPSRDCTPKPSRIIIGGPQAPPVAEGQPSSARGEEIFAPLAVFLARAHPEGRLIDLYGIALDGEVIDAAATSTRRFGPVVVATTVHAPGREGGPNATELSLTGKGPRPDGAEFHAGAPFSGHATFKKRPGSPPTWLGSLAVRIPGEGKLSLAGPDFDAIICRYEPTKPQRACERSVAPPHTV